MPNVMGAGRRIDPSRYVGRSPDRLSLEERFAVAGMYAAFEMYTPQTLPLRRIEALGDSVAECAQSLKSRGLDVTRFEFLRLAPPYPR